MRQIRFEGGRERSAPPILRGQIAFGKAVADKTDFDVSVGTMLGAS